MLSGFLFLPLVFVVALSLQKTKKQIKILSLLCSLLHLGLCAYLMSEFDYKATTSDQMTESHLLFKPLGFHYAVALDGLSLLLALMVTVIIPVVILGTWNRSCDNLKSHYVGLLGLEFCALGFFLSRDLLLSLLFYEGSIVPVLFLMSSFKKQYGFSALKSFFVCSFISSALLFLGTVALAVLHGSVFEGVSLLFSDVEQVNVPFVSGTLYSTQTLIFLCFLLGFLIKISLFPFHLWLAKTHGESSSGGLAALTVLVLSSGVYGMMRIFPMFFLDALKELSWLVCMLSVSAVLYGGMVAYAETKVKRLLAYLTVSQMGLIVLGLFSMSEYGSLGALYLLLNFGLASCGLFLIFEMLEQRVGLKRVDELYGLSKIAPKFSILAFLLALCAVSAPLTGNFIGSFFITLGVYEASLYYAFFTVFGIFLSACCMIKLVFSICFHSPKTLEKEVEDLTLVEFFSVLALIVLIILMGLFPNFILSIGSGVFNA